MREKNQKLIVIGGGAAGMMAAIAAARKGAPVQILERNSKVGRKLYITGKGRCNVTNHCSVQEVLAATPRNGRFLYSSLTRMPPSNVEKFFFDLGVELKVERGDRVFPKSDKAADIIDALFFELKRLKVPVVHTRATDIVCEGGTVCAVETEDGKMPCRGVILATGGMSYPATGSTGDGYRMAEELGHTIVEPKPSLVPLESPDAMCGEMQGLSLKNVVVTIKNQKKKVFFRGQGEMLFTHFGLSGPLILSASAHMRDYEKNTYTCLIDLKPALDEQALDARLLRELTANANRDMANIMGTLLPRVMTPVVLKCTGIPIWRKAHDLTREERHRLRELLKAFPVSISGPRSIEDAIVTSGGIKVNEVDPKTMGSKKVSGLFFAGELLDVDAYTGGFNLQIAWATGWAAGESIADLMKEQNTMTGAMEYEQ